MAEQEQKTVFLFYGEDTFSSNKKLRFWEKEFIKKYGEDTNTEVIEGKTLNPAEFLTNIESLPFLSEKRMVIVKDFLKYGKPEIQKKVADNIGKVPNFCIIIFHENETPDKRTSLFQKIKKIGQTKEFPALSPEKVTNWILKEARERQIKISTTNANFLTTHCGAELWAISNELEKLKTYALDKEITKEMIEKLSTPSLSASIFKFTDALAEKNSKQSLKIFKILIDGGEDAIKIFFMIVRHFRILIQVHDMINKGEQQHSITKRLKLHPFVAQTTSNQSKNFDTDKLKNIYQELLNIDIGVKTGLIKSSSQDHKEFYLAIEKFILHCCK